MLEAWNGLFMKEMLPKLESMARPLSTDLKSVTARNEKATATQIESEDGTRELAPHLGSHPGGPVASGRPSGRQNRSSPLGSPRSPQAC